MSMAMENRLEELGVALERTARAQSQVTGSVVRLLDGQIMGGRPGSPVTEIMFLAPPPGYSGRIRLRISKERGEDGFFDGFIKLSMTYNVVRHTMTIMPNDWDSDPQTELARVLAFHRRAMSAISSI